MPADPTPIVHPLWMVLAQDGAASPAGGEVTGVLGAEGSSAEGAASDNGSGATTTSQPGGMNFMMPMLLMFVVLMVFMTLSSGRRQKREKAERDAMLDGLSRSDRVEMLGGEIGSIVEIDNETVVVKVHEATDTRIRFARSAVKTVLRASGSSSADDDHGLVDDKNAA